MVKMTTLRDVKRKLEERGAVFKTETSGYIPVKQRLAEPRILKYRETDTTPPLMEFRQDVVRNYVHRNIVTFDRFGPRPMYLFRKVCTKYHDPQILYKLSPVRIPTVTLHMLSGKLTGEIKSKFNNNSKEGEEGRYVTWRWRACSSEEDAYSWEKVAGSADIMPDWLHEAVETTTEKVIAKVEQALEKVTKDDRVSVEASFETTGLLDIIWDLLDIFTTGTVTMNDGYDVTLKYKWKGETQTVNKHVDCTVALPVDNVDWNLD